MSARENDDGGGRPEVRPRVVETSTGGKPLENRQKIPERSAATPVGSQPFSGYSSWMNPFRSSSLSRCIFLVMLCLGFWVFMQLATLWRDLQTMPIFLSLPFGALAGGLLCLIIYHIGRLWWQWRSLQESPRWQWHDLQLLEDQEELKMADLKKAKAQLKNHLQETPWEDPQYQKALGLCGLQDADLQRILSIRTQLLELESADSLSWLRRYSELYVSELDELAKARIRRSAVRLGLSTASCPHRQLDGLLTLWSSFELCGDLCKIYNLRLGKPALLILLLRSFRNTFIATQVEDLADHALDSLTDQLHQGLSGLATEVGQWLGSRMAEGTANAWLLYRLGKATQRQLRPIGVWNKT
jgi:uncharacterized membrane protein YcjF (UPF0283 family)